MEVLVAWFYSTSSNLLQTTSLHTLYATTKLDYMPFHISNTTSLPMLFNPLEKPFPHFCSLKSWTLFQGSHKVPFLLFLFGKKWLLLCLGPRMLFLFLVLHMSHIAKIATDIHVCVCVCVCGPATQSLVPWIQEFRLIYSYPSVTSNTILYT